MDIGTMLLIGGGAIQAGASIYGGQSAIKQGKYQQDILQYQAKYIEAASKIEEEKIRRQLRKVIGAQRAATAAAGFQADAGTPLELQIASEMEADLDIALMRQAGSIEQLRLMTQGYAARAESYGLASGLYFDAGATALDTLLAQGARHGWFKPAKGKNPASSLSGGSITASQPQRLRWSNR